MVKMGFHASSIIFRLFDIKGQIKALRRNRFALTGICTAENCFFDSSLFPYHQSEEFSSSALLAAHKMCH
jgi:hypothetical protein